MNSRTKIKKEMTKVIKSVPEVERVILFGSRARGDEEDRSDIDIAVKAPHATQRQWLDIVREIEELNTLLSIDLIKIDEASSALKKSISREGIVLYERS